MERDKAIALLGKYFDISELVSKAVYTKYGQSAWRFFSTDLLETLIALRTEILKVPLVCNNWKSGGSYTQRGFRENTCELVAEKTKKGTMYLSAHTIGKGVDLSSGKMTAAQMRTAIKKLAYKLPHKVRVEDGVNWLHIDTMTDPNQQQTVYLFKV